MQFVGGATVQEAIKCFKTDCPDKALYGRQYHTILFPKQKTTAEYEAKKFADRKATQMLTGLDSRMSEIDRKQAYDSAHEIAFKAEFERKFVPLKYFILSIRSFYQKAISEILKRFTFEDPVYNILELVKPINARKLNPPSLFNLFERFPILKEFCDIDSADVEWRSHINLSLSHFGCSTESDFMKMPVNTYWNKVFQSKDLSGNQQHPNLKVCLSLLLCLPFSNATAERVFSAMKVSKSPQRNRLDDETIAALLKTKSWLKNQNATAASVNIPSSLMKCVSEVKY